MINEKELIWYPAEVNTSIRPGWFYHPEEDDKVKSLDELVSIYEKSVGGNATFLLNIPPDTRGLLAQGDVDRLKELGEYLRNRYKSDLTECASLSFSGNLVETHDCLVRTKDGCRDLTIFVNFPSKVEIGRIIIEENLTYSQRIEKFSIEAYLNDTWESIYEGTTVGYRKIVALDKTVTDGIRIKITESRVSVCLKRISVYS